MQTALLKLRAKQRKGAKQAKLSEESVPSGAAPVSDEKKLRQIKARMDADWHAIDRLLNNRWHIGIWNRGLAAATSPSPFDRLAKGEASSTYQTALEQQLDRDAG